MKRVRDWLRTLGMYLIDRDDVKRFDAYANTVNGSARLTAWHDAVLDADDTLEAVSRAIRAGDHSEAMHLIALGRSSLQDHLAELKDLL